MPNQFTGHKAPGFRFCFHVSSVAHRPLFLPLEMKTLPEIQRLLKGESPLSVFNCNSIKEARKAFCQFRYTYDFAYWAAREYYIYDINNSSKTIPLILNDYQFHIIDTFQKRYHNHESGRYFITKSFGKVGVTTCVQAYILWIQIFKSPKNSCLCTFTDSDSYFFRKNINRFLKRESVFSQSVIDLPNADQKAFFLDCCLTEDFREKELGYVHLADMSKWYDKGDNYTESAISNLTSNVSKSFDTLVVQEGNIPKEDQIDMQKVQNPYTDRFHRFCYIEHLTNNPPFLLNVIMNSTLGSPYFHINLDHIHFASPS